MSEIAVRVVDHPHPLDHFVSASVLTRTPLVIRTGGLQSLDWRSHRWSNEYLSERVGPQQVSVQKRGGSHFGPVPAGGYKLLPFPDFVREVMGAENGNPDWYLNIQSMERMMMAPALQLMGDFNVPVYFRDLLLRWITMWMGNTPDWSTSRLHNDYHDNLYVVTVGHKRFRVCAPQFAPRLYTVGNIRRIHPNGVVEYAPGNYPAGPHFSRIPPGPLNTAEFPDAVDIPFEYAELGAGDIFYLPAGWFHEVASRGRHISVNFWADPPR